jgi:hypothetical protein
VSFRAAPKQKQTVDRTKVILTRDPAIQVQGSIPFPLLFSRVKNFKASTNLGILSMGLDNITSNKRQVLIYMLLRLDLLATHKNLYLYKQNTSRTDCPATESNHNKAKSTIEHKKQKIKSIHHEAYSCHSEHNLAFFLSFLFTTI